MIRAKNISCFLRSIDKRDAGKTVIDGQEVKWDAGYKLELDIYDPEASEQKNKLKTCVITLADNETHANYYEKMRYLTPMTPFVADLDVVISKSGVPKINLDKIHLNTLEHQKTK